MTAVYLIRHGQASFGRSNYDKLSDLGHEQARLLGESLRPRVPFVHAAVTGAMVRHKQTAKNCLEAMQAQPATQEDAGFNEFDHEEIIERFRPRYANRVVLAAELAATLKPRKAFQELFSQAIERWVSGQYDHEYKESWPAFRGRCVRSLEQLTSSLGSSQTALVFTSAGPITAVTQALLQIPDAQAIKLNWTQVNCAITKVIVGSRGMHLSTLNDHAHFEPEAKRLVTYR